MDFEVSRLQNGRKMVKHLEKNCRKGFFRRSEASKWHKTTVFTQVCAPFRDKTLYTMVLGCVRFKVATKHRKY